MKEIPAVKIKIAFVQILPGKNADENLLIGKEACIEAKENSADIVLFPEMWSDGYDLPQNEAELRKLAIRTSGASASLIRDSISSVVRSSMSIILRMIIYLRSSSRQTDYS